MLIRKWIWMSRALTQFSRSTPSCKSCKARLQPWITNLQITSHPKIIIAQQDPHRINRARLAHRHLKFKKRERAIIWKKDVQSRLKMNTSLWKRGIQQLETSYFNSKPPTNRRWCAKIIYNSNICTISATSTVIQDWVSRPKWSHADRNKTTNKGTKIYQMCRGQPVHKTRL